MAKHTLNLYYNVQDGADGSYYPHFFDSLALAELDSEIEVEVKRQNGMGEPCTGTITLESDSPITCKNITVMTAKEYIEDLEESYGDESATAEYVEKLKKLL